MKIGIIGMGLETSQDFRFAGVARYAFSLMDEIARGAGAEHEFIFFLLPGFEVPLHWSKRKNLKIHRTWKRYNKWTLFASGGVARRMGLNFLYSTASATPVFSRIPIGVFIHDLFPLDHPEWFPQATASVNQRTIPASIRRSQVVFTNSEHTKQAIERRFHTPPEKVVVTPLAAGNPVSAVPREKVNWERLSSLGVRGSRYVLTLSTIEPRKNLGRVFEAFAEARKSIPGDDVQLVVAGSQGWKYEAALGKIEELGIADRTCLLGYVPDEALPDLFSGCELYLCASISEGFGMPLVEAMSAGCPVLSSRGGALPEVGGEAVRYFDPESVPAIRDALVDALSHPEQNEAWSEKSLRQSAKFTWRQTAELTLAQIARIS